ncbi:hypothetical protein PASE110613_07360 [Paenibacillus sediminis]|uniref:DUF2642 domain-containing protein n=1 Tax=Paenibacillus sediminis TaxID=664909 RepID=A0ABS4H2U5_9BACL|nr:hypothetical protein [Paenibacillus sediminis]MBP1936844.1 hypothetical protein [Paenibacillus sediminis]
MQPATSEVFKQLVEQVVCINRNGPELKKGRLIAVKDDHLVLLTDEQYCYYQTQHIKSVTVNSIVQPSSSIVPYPHRTHHLDGINFNDVLQKMVYRSVQINQGGPEYIDGVLTGVLNNHIILVQGFQIIRVATFHIKNVSFNLRSQNTKQQSNDKAVKASSEGDEIITTKDVPSNEVKDETPIQENELVIVKTVSSAVTAEDSETDDVEEKPSLEVNDQAYEVTTHAFSENENEDGDLKLLDLSSQEQNDVDQPSELPLSNRSPPKKRKNKPIKSTVSTGRSAISHRRKSLKEKQETKVIAKNKKHLLPQKYIFKSVWLSPMLRNQFTR